MAAELIRVNTWMAKMLPFLATPLVGTPPPGFVCKPAAMPPTCVPCSHRLTLPLRHGPIGCAAPAPVWLDNPIGPCLNGDRKSTRLNSSHVRISYAVFCLKKKKLYAYRTSTNH